MANQFLALSLFLMLLSFFIVMNAVSGYEKTKTQPVMKSLSLAFSNKEIVEDHGPSEEPTMMMNLGKGDTLSKIEGLFDGHIANFTAKRNRLGTIMHVRLPVLAFKRAIEMPQLQSKDDSKLSNLADESFLQTLVTLLRAEENNLPYRMDMILETSYQPDVISEETQSRMRSDLTRVSGFASRLENYGMPQQYISAGLQFGETGYVSLYFKRYEHYSPLEKKHNDEQKSESSSEVPL
tara:strand:- start:5221 stop:5931 length:711 start_codon:yes stop_codon:yes gene_type:complete